MGCAPSDEDRVIALVAGALFMTDDGGESWFQVAVLPESRAESSESDAYDPFPDEEEYDVGDDELSDFESRQTEWLPLETDTSPSDSLERVVSDVHLVVSDTGVFAVLLGGRLLVGNRSGVVRTLAEQDIEGLAFDRADGLHVATRNALVHYPNPLMGAGHSIPIQCRGVPVVTPDNRVLVPTEAGLLILARGERRSMRVGPVDAVGLFAGDLLVAMQGALHRFYDERSKGVLPKGPFPIRRIVTDSNGTTMVETADGWFALREISWRALQVSTLAVDASGRVWVGTEQGPFLQTQRVTGVAEALDVSALVTLTRMKLDTNPGPPPRCRRFPIHPLPLVRLNVGYQRGLLLWFESYEIPAGHPMPYGARRVDEVYVGIHLAWSLDPIVPTDCIERQQIWQATLDRNRADVLSMWRAQLRSVEPSGNRERVFIAAAAALERERKQELVRLLTE